MREAGVDAYFAGFFDGEGHVTLHLSKGRYMTRILGMTNCDRAVLDLAVMEYGGSVRLKQSRAATRRPCYVWQICGDAATSFARRIVPHTMVKTRELDVFIRAEEVMLGNQPVTPELATRRAVIVTELRAVRAHA